MSSNRRYYPALRGLFGDWVYYSCLMSMDEVAARLSYAEDIHKSKKLSEMIQRKLKEGRSKEIAQYLLAEKQRFFNSLVVAIYGGDPAWHGFSNFRPQVEDISLSDVPTEAENSVGFLSFSGQEEIFAIDGQHRLAGMKEALKKNQELGKDEVSLVLVAHQKTPAGQERTRRLFTTLNKTAVAVGKGEVIALDENDVMAIVTRHLVENSTKFGDTRIRFSQGESLPKDADELTTIGNLYDNLKVLFSNMGYAAKPAELRFIRPNDEDLKKYIALAEDFFDGLAKAFPPLGDYFAATAASASAVVKKHRRANGGHVLFRPIGLRLMAELVVEIVRSGKTLKSAIATAKRVPVQLSKAPYKGVIWLPNGLMNPAGRAVCRRLLLHMLGYEKKPTDLLARYAKMLGRDAASVTLPPLIK
ncbi:MAG: DNA sulfur modification protein DndB [Vicinamibacterales bacterium]